MRRFYYVLIIGFLVCAALILPARAQTGLGYYPAGLHRSAIVSGVYAGTDPGNCCWMGSHSTLKLAVPHGADTLLLTVIVPDYAASNAGQSLRLRVAGQPAQERCCFGQGMHELSFRLPPGTDEHSTIVLHLSARNTFVPKSIGLNDDTRHLSLLIRGVAYFDSQTGELLGGSSAPDLQSAPLIWLVLAVIVVLALTLRRPFFGAAALLLTDPFLLGHAFHGTTLTLPKVALVAVAIGLAPRLPQLLQTRGKYGTFWVLLGAQVLVVLSMAASSVHAASHSAALRETLKAFEYAVTFAVMYAAYRIDPGERALRVTISIAACAVAMLALAQEFVGAPEGEMIHGHAVARIAGPLEGPNQLAGYLGVVVPAMLAFTLSRRALLLERAAIALACAACLLTFSKAGIAALLVAIVIVAAVRYLPRARAATAAATATVCLSVFAFTAATAAPTDHFNGGLGVRSDLWHGAYEMWRAHPLLGVGPGNFELQIGRYDPGVRTHANSMYFQALAEQGVVGLIALLAVVAASIVAFIRRLEHPLALGAGAAAVAMAFHQLVDCMFVYPKVGVMWWLLLALGAVIVDLPETSKDVAEGAVA